MIVIDTETIDLRTLIAEVAPFRRAESGWWFEAPPVIGGVRWCVDCGSRIDRDTGYVLTHGGLGCHDCGLLEAQLGPSLTVRAALNRMWRRKELNATIELICTGRVTR